MRCRMRTLFYLLFVIFALTACNTAQSAGVPSRKSDPELMAEVTLVFARATGTQSAYQAQAQAATDQAYQGMIYSTQVSAQTQTMQAIESAQTAQAAATWSGATSTALSRTEQINRDKLNATRTTIWGGVVVVLAACLLILMWAAVKIWDMYIETRARKLASERVE